MPTLPVGYFFAPDRKTPAPCPYGVYTSQGTFFSPVLVKAAMSERTQLPTNSETPLTPGSYVLYFKAADVTPAMFLNPNWAQRAAQNVKTEDGATVEYTGGGYVTTNGVQLYTVGLDVTDDDDVSTEGALTLGVVVLGLLVALFIATLEVVKVEKLGSALEQIPEQSIKDISNGIKWLGVGAAALGVAVLVGMFT